MLAGSFSPSNSSHDLTVYLCPNSSSVVSVVVARDVSRAVLLLPLSVLILHLGHRRWRRQRSLTTTSHSDFFTYHQAALELVWGLGLGLFLCGRCSDVPGMVSVGYSIKSIIFSAQTQFHVLTCVDRYLAVVHPVVYLGLRRSGGVRIRNVTAGCVWLSSVSWCALRIHYYPQLPLTPFFIFLIFSLIVVSFCSLSVLCVLIRPGPGEAGGEKERVDQSKQRAFHTIMAILTVLLLWFVAFLICLALVSSSLLSTTEQCLLIEGGVMLNLPSSLVLPLLFLHRAGKLSCCNRQTQG